MAWALNKANVAKEDLLTWAVYALNWGYGASITGIDNDQWSAISTETYGKEDKFQTYIQCDDVLDGIAFTIKAYYDKFGEGRDW